MNPTQLRKILLEGNLHCDKQNSSFATMFWRCKNSGESFLVSRPWEQSDSVQIQQIMTSEHDLLNLNFRARKPANDVEIEMLEPIRKDILPSLWMQIRVSLLLYFFSLVILKPLILDLTLDRPGLKNTAFMLLRFAASLSRIQLISI